MNRDGIFQRRDIVAPSSKIGDSEQHLSLSLPLVNPRVECPAVTEINFR